MLAIVTLLALLAAPPATDSIVVTAHPPGPLGDTAEDVNVVSRTAVQNSAAPAVDDALRQVPGFTLFRRTDSRAANPTSQGVSLRGIGASGASRALVLDDGIPLNDPFGGWVYWGRVPEAALERVEVLRGGVSDLYGSSAMGGVIDFVRRDRTSIGAGDVQLDASRGSQGMRTTSLFAAVPHVSVAADLFDTDGYILTQPSQRGAVDVAATSRHTSLDATVRKDAAFLRAMAYDETRGNGTPLTVNDTHLRQLAAGIDASSLALRGYVLEQRYHQTFSSIAIGRASERLTVDQRVPSRSSGGSLDWRRTFGSTLVHLGGDVRDVEGTSHERTATALTTAGGHQRSTALRAMLLWQRDRLTITGGGRYDGWRNFDAEQSGAPLPSRRDRAWSPRVTALYELAPRRSLSASAYSCFRAPSLNELYRGFRVGNVVTQPNAQLGPERLTGFEVGARDRDLRVTFFAMRIADTIANVTLATTPALITRRRQNFGSSRSRGAEVEWSHVTCATTLTAGYLFADATLSSGARTPQVPRHQATLQLAQRSGGMTFGLQSRWSSRQFDDDLNQFPLRSAFATDLFASRNVVRNLDVIAAVENLFNARVEASATPVITLAQPRAVRVGMRYTLAR